MELIAGSIVKCRNRLWVLLPSEDESIYLLRPLTGSQDDVVAIHRELTKYIASSIPEERLESASFPLPTPDDVSDAVSAHLLWHSARLTLREGATPFRSLGHISIRPRPYQLVPLLMALRINPIRLLIADDVGVGKTIEALLIARELYDRKEIKRLAVLCPPYLCDQWQKELGEKFNMEAVIVRSGTVGQLERRLPPGKSIYEYYPFQVISIDFIKTEKNKYQFLLYCPELVIVDEVHGATERLDSPQQQQRYRFLQEVVSKHQPHLLLLTATPHSGIETAFRSILALLNPEFGQWDTSQLREEQRDTLARYFVQRTRKDIENEWEESKSFFPIRISQDYTYHLSQSYKELFSKTYQFCSEIVRTSEGLEQRKRRVRYWAALSLLRCIMSSPSAAIRALQARRGGKREIEEAEEIESFAPSVFEPSEEIVDDGQPTPAIESAEEELKEEEKGKLRQLEQMAEAILQGGEDKKLEGCVELVLKLLKEGYKPIIWCRYIATAEYVANELEKCLSTHFTNVRVTAVTGLMGDEERKAKVEELGEYPYRVLVATDCLSEGINLQEWFSAVIHYDLPWNPNKLEQREGRVDRYGQVAKQVKAIRYYSPDNPVDGIVIRVLLDKAKEIHKALGTYVPIPQDSESVMEAVLRALFLRHQTLPFQLSLDLFPEEVQQLHTRWDYDKERERINRTKFAQKAIQPQEILRELEKTDTVLGNPDEVRSFVLNACQRTGIRIMEDMNPDIYCLYPSDNLPQIIYFPPGLKEKGKVWRISFISPTPAGAEYVGRNHRFVQSLAQFLLEEALSKKGEAIASRAGAIRTKAVSKLTVLLLLRARYLLKQPNHPPLFSEEVLVRSYRYDSPLKISWLTPEESLTLLSITKPDENIPLQEKRELVEIELSKWEERKKDVERILEERAQELLESHKRIRRTIAMGVRGMEVTPQLPPDLLGILVLQPVVKR